jgi:thiol-disulfide isomerase/thioredoxin
MVSGGCQLLRCLFAVVLGLVSGLAPLLGADLPRRSPEYAIKLTTGQQLLLSSYRGRVVFLLFVNTDCPHCQDTCRLMEQIQKEYGPRGFQTLAVAFNDMALMYLPGFIKTTGATFPVGYDAREPVLAYLQSSPRMVPVGVFIDRKGMIRAQHAGDGDFWQDREKNIRSMVEKLLKEPGGGPPSATKVFPSAGKKTP